MEELKWMADGNIRTEFYSLNSRSGGTLWLASSTDSALATN